MLNLKARGGVMHDILVNLWKVYFSVSDSLFIAYKKENKTSYDEGQDIDVEELIVQAENKYNTVIHKEK